MHAHPIDVAAKKLGSQASLASELGVSRGAVNQWKEAGRAVPIEHCAAIERLCGAAVTRRDLRPNDWWHIWPELVTTDHPAPHESLAAQASDAA